MFCTACAVHNPDRLPRCAGCGASLAARRPVVSRPAARGGRVLSRLLGWFRVVPVLAVMLGLAGAGGSYARQSNRQADAYAAGEAAVARGDSASAEAAFDEAGAYRDAADRRLALIDRLAPSRAGVLAAVDALGSGDPDAAIALLTAVLRDEPGDDEARALLEQARERRRDKLAADAEVASSRKDWLTAEALLAQLVAERPDPARTAELAEIRLRRSPLLFTVDGDIHLATPEGGDPVVVLDGFDALYPTWSPDRRSIAFYTQVGQTVVAYNLWVVDRDGGGMRLVADHVYPETFAAWSPDGASIAYVNQQSFEIDDRVGVTSIRVVHLATGETTDLTDTAAYQALSPSWSPDGHRVAFVSKILYGRSSTVTWRQIGSVMVADLDRGTVVDVTTDRLRFVEYVAWSPTSDHLALWSRETASSWQETTITTIHLLDLPTGELTEVTGRSRMVSRPVWAPDGGRFAYVDGDKTVKIDGVDGSSREIVLSTPIFPALSWSPDGAGLIAPAARPVMGSPVVPVDGPEGEIGFHFPIPWDLSGDLVGPPRWGGGRPAAPVVAPTSAGVALDPP